MSFASPSLLDTLKDSDQAGTQTGMGYVPPASPGWLLLSRFVPFHLLLYVTAEYAIFLANIELKYFSSNSDKPLNTKMKYDVI